MRLYEIATQYQALQDHLYDEDGVIDDKSIALLDEHSELMQDKCVALSSVIKNMEAERQAIANAMKNMESRAIRISDKMNLLQNYLKENMERCGISEIKCPQFVIKVKRNPESIEVFDEESIPKTYKVEQITWKVDKRKLKQDIREGISIPGAGLKQNTRLEIK
jgi:hypothetical protein